MDRVLIPTEWFDAIAPDSYFEADFEGRLRANCRQLFPDWFFVPFKVNVTARDTGYGAKQPDFALIDRQYRQWWVVEAEIASHSLNDHVLPQVIVFSLGEYGSEHVDYVSAQEAMIERSKLNALIEHVAPGVLVVVNDDVPGWKPILQRHHIELCVVKPYRDQLGHSAYLVRGTLPRPDSTLITFARRADGLPRTLLLENAQVVPFQDGAAIELLGPGARPGTWRFFLAGDRAYLMALTTFPFSETSVEFELHTTIEGRYEITPLRKGRILWRFR